jgi:hypothetical protein
MGKCRNHPDRDTRIRCMKNEVDLCGECAVCQSPELYCKFRTSCPIWFVRTSIEDWGVETRVATQEDNQ